MLAGTRRQVRKRFGVATERDSKFAAEIGTRGQSRFEKCAEIFADLFGLRDGNETRNAERGHQANGADGELSGLNDGVVAEDTDFEAAAAKINYAAQRGFWAERAEDRFPAQA